MLKYLIVLCIIFSGSISSTTEDRQKLRQPNQREYTSDRASTSSSISASSNKKTPRTKTRVAIVGGGPSGLIMARHMVTQTEVYHFEVFEQTQQIGGIWAYTNETETDKNGLPVHSSLYKNLRTNLPKEMMEVSEFPFKDSEGPSFIHHSVVYQYLLDYAQHFNLYPYIKLNTLVEHVEPEKLANGQVVWTVSYRDLRTNVQTVKTYDAVVVCNGHLTVGYIPKISGMDSFKGIAIHSHKYRMPEVYAGKNVCIIGGSWSAVDITMEVSQYANRIYLSHYSLKSLDLSMLENVEKKPGVDYVNQKTVVFQDGSSAEIDVFIYCTGYQFTYPFLSSKVEVRTEDNHVEPIYKHLIHMDWTNLFFLGIPINIINFRIFNIQAQYVLGVIEGRIILPSPKQMREEYDKEKKSLLDKGIAARHLNKLMERQWPYYNELAEAVGFPTLPPVIKKMYDHWLEMRKQNVSTYRNYHYKIVDKDNFVVTFYKLC